MRMQAIRKSHFVPMDKELYKITTDSRFSKEREDLPCITINPVFDKPKGGEN